MEDLRPCCLSSSTEMKAVAAEDAVAVVKCVPAGQRPRVCRTTRRQVKIILAEMWNVADKPMIIGDRFMVYI